jgi:protein gp37
VGEKSKIAWTDASWTIVTGCSRVSEACRNCYAEELSLRYGWTKQPWTAGNAAENVKCHEDRLNWPLKWSEGKRIFVTSMGDLFHDEVPEAFILRVFGVMAATPRHTYQVLTKRPERMAALLSKWTALEVSDAGRSTLAFLKHREAEYEAARRCAWPLPNVWCGTTVEDQRNADERIPHLLRVPAAARFLSVEPMLGPVRLWAPEIGEWPTEEPKYPIANAEEWDDWKYWTARDRGIHWVIVGGESGRHARPMAMDWARALRDQCAAAGVAFFFKQDSARLPGQRPYLVEEDGRRLAYHQFPGELAAPVEVHP